jgi:surface antigen
VVDSRTSPNGDGLFDLFGDVAATSSVAPTAPQGTFTSRRDRRNAESGVPIMPVAPVAPPAPVAAVQPVAQVVPVAPVAQVVSFESFFADPVDQVVETHQPRSRRPRKPQKLSRRELKRQRARERSLPVVRSYAQQYPGAKKIVIIGPAPKPKKYKASGLLTMLAVGGLFASVALPAYAFAPTADADNRPKSAAVLGNSISVSDKVIAADATRSNFTATTAAALKRQTATAMMAANYSAYMASGAREAGDDYPWFSELSNNQGGGLSPLNYFYRECVDFVAWRLNRDAGSTSAPFLWTWKSLTPTGGNAYQWKYAWIKHGWPTGSAPAVGAVAWYSYNHVAYVKSVNADGTVTVEDYNQSGYHVYDQRVVPAGSVSLYLYAPPHP